jgi:hypothetical protein
MPVLNAENLSLITLISSGMPDVADILLTNARLLDAIELSLTLTNETLINEDFIL